MAKKSVNGGGGARNRSFRGMLFAVGSLGDAGPGREMPCIQHGETTTEAGSAGGLGTAVVRL